MSVPPRWRCCLEILHERRHRVGGVAADQQDRLGPRNVRQRERQAAIDPERAQARRRGGRHAEAPVVVDIGGPQRHARELAEHVGLLVGEAAAAEHADRVGARRRLDRTQSGDDPVERLRPSSPRSKAPPCARAPAAWSAGRARRAVRRRSSPSGTGRPVGGEIARSDLQAAMLRDQAHAALQSAVRAVSRRLRAGRSRSYLQIRAVASLAPHVVRQRVLTLLSPTSANVANAANTRRPAW